MLEYAQQYQLNWVEDPSNQSSEYDRNFIRHQLIPKIKKRWPSIDKTVLRSLSHLFETQKLLDEVAEEDLEGLIGKDFEPWLDIVALKLKSQSRQANAIRKWLSHFELSASSQLIDQLLALIEKETSQWLDSKAEFKLGDQFLRIHKGRLYLSKIEPEFTFEPFLWQVSQPCRIEGYGELSLSGENELTLQIKPRAGGEEVYYSDSAQTKKLKKILQEQDIPHWQKASLPLIYYKEELIAASHLLRFEKANEVLGSSVISCRSL